MRVSGEWARRLSRVLEHHAGADWIEFRLECDGPEREVVVWEAVYEDGRVYSGRVPEPALRSATPGR